MHTASRVRSDNRHSISALVVTLLLSASFPVNAGNQALETLLKALNENGTIDNATYALIKNIANEEAQTKQRSDISISEFRSEQVIDRMLDQKIASIKRDLKPKVKLGGRIQADSAAYREDEIDHNSGTELRRVRLFAQGELSKNWGFKLQYDFTATGNSGIQDAFIDYKGLATAKIRLGHFKEPFSLQNITSSKNTLFTERGLPYLFAEGRNIGIQASRQGKNWSIAAGIFGDGRDGAKDDNEGWGLSSRGTFAPIFEKNHYLHFGASLSYRHTGSEQALRFSARPESHVTNTKIVDTGTFDADSYLRAVMETAYVNGPFNLQGEYYLTSVERALDGNPDVDFSGFYVEGGWFFTGNSMNYKGASGNFGKISPKSVVGKGGYGAWQIALRYSSLDLTDGDINGGEAESVTFGLNWFPTAKLRFSLNYVDILDVDGGPNPGDEPSAFQFRSQVAF